ncbi:Retrotransposon gag protein [Popillia japonica]|uniref:Retrotransposon gag protein n=1 Tax=Popillia japonica TaxID=7064 RepID=A0AAW1K1E2_POPJA
MYARNRRHDESNNTLIGAECSPFLLNTLKDNQIREQTPVNNDEIRNFNIMPDLSKSIETFNAEKGPKDAADWLRRLETTGRLHSWPDLETTGRLHSWPETIMFETARAHLVGAAKHWYQGRSKELKDWNDFKTAFKKTFLLEKSKTELWKCMQSRRQQRTESIHSYFHESIETFNAEKGPKDAADWLRRLETTGRLHSWPETIMFETARAHLVGAAKHWYQGRSKELKDWNDFKTAFKKTFLLEKSKTELWKCMQSRRQQRTESIHSYFHEKVSLCRELNLPFSEIKEQVVVGFWSRDMSNYIMARQHTDKDDLYKDIVVYKRVDSVQRGAVMDQIRGKKEETTTVNIRDVKKDPKIEKDRKAVKCFNFGGPEHVATTCTKPKRPKGSCFQCISQEHQVKDFGKAKKTKRILFSMYIPGTPGEGFW